MRVTGEGVGGRVLIAVGIGVLAFSGMACRGGGVSDFRRVKPSDLCRGVVVYAEPRNDNRVGSVYGVYARFQMSNGQLFGPVVLLRGNVDEAYRELWRWQGEVEKWYVRRDDKRAGGCSGVPEDETMKLLGGAVPPEVPIVMTWRAGLWRAVWPRNNDVRGPIK